MIGARWHRYIANLGRSHQLGPGNLDETRLVAASQNMLHNVKSDEKSKCQIKYKENKASLKQKRVSPVDPASIRGFPQRQMLLTTTSAEKAKKARKEKQCLEGKGGADERVNNTNLALSNHNENAND